MARARDDHTFHDAGFGGHLNELTPEQRKARDDLQKELSKEAGESAQRVVDSFTAPRKPGIWDAAAVAANLKASEIRTPAQERAGKLGYELRPDGSLVSSKLAEARKAQREEGHEGTPSPEETEAFMREVEEEEEAEFRASLEAGLEDD
jgi:hypothetical protein